MVLPCFVGGREINPKPNRQAQKSPPPRGLHYVEFWTWTEKYVSHLFAAFLCTNGQSKLPFQLATETQSKPNQLRPASGLAIDLPLRSSSVEEQFPNLQHLAYHFGSGPKTFVFVSRGEYRFLKNRKSSPEAHGFQPAAHNVFQQLFITLNFLR